MNKIIEFETEDGKGAIAVEVEGSGRGGGMVRASTAGETLERSVVKFENALGPIQRVADLVITKIRQIAESPSEVAVEFGLKFSAEAGVVISKASAEANFKISVKWTSKEK